MKEDQQTMTKYLPFKTKRRSVAQTVFIWQRFEEKLSFYHNPILRFSVHILKGQPMLKEHSNFNGLAKIILLDLVRSYVLQIFGLLKKSEAAVIHVALKLSNINTKPNRLIHFFWCLLINQGYTYLGWKIINQSHRNSKQKQFTDQNTIKWLEIDSFEYTFHLVSDKADFSPAVRIFIS